MKSLPSHVQYGFEVEAKNARRPLYRQVHGADLIEIEGPSHRDTLVLAPPSADGAYTFAGQTELYVFTADCLPVLFFGSEPTDPIATVHCGWRGAKLQIVAKTIELLSRSTRELSAVLGPCIQGCCFEVRQDFVEEFARAGQNIAPFLEEFRGRLFFNLADYVRETQLKAIPPERIYADELRCTYCSAPPLPSFRRNKGTDPHIRSWICKR